MVIVQEIIDTKSKELFDKAKTLEFVLYKNNGMHTKHQLTAFVETTELYEVLTPLVYASSKEELEDYAKRNEITNYEITHSPFI